MPIVILFSLIMFVALSVHKWIEAARYCNKIDIFFTMLSIIGAVMCSMSLIFYLAR